MTGARRVYLNVSWALFERPDMGRHRILEALAEARVDQARGALPKEIGPVRREPPEARGGSERAVNSPDAAWSWSNARRHNDGTSRKNSGARPSRSRAGAST
jgi:hypothetical protein